MIKGIDAMQGSEYRFSGVQSITIYAFGPPAVAAFASSAAATAGFTFFPSFHRTRGGGARLRRPSRERTRTTKELGQSISNDTITESHTV